MRLRKDKNAEQTIEENSSLVIKDTKANVGNWKKLYNKEKVYLEIGMGKGKFVTENALKNPDVLYIGLEREATVVVKALKKIKDLNISNLVLMNEDATLIKDFFSKGEIDKIYLNFSDPWPKNRHTKRRLTHEAFLEDYKYILSDEGDIELKTDNAKLFAYTVLTFNNYQMKLLDLSVDLHNEREGIITTEYEERFIGENKPIYYLKTDFRNR